MGGHLGSRGKLDCIRVIVVVELVANVVDMVDRVVSERVNRHFAVTLNTNISCNANVLFSRLRVLMLHSWQWNRDSVQDDALLCDLFEQLMGLSLCGGSSLRVVDTVLVVFCVVDCSKLQERSFVCLWGGSL